MDTHNTERHTREEERDGERDRDTETEAEAEAETEQFAKVFKQRVEVEGRG